MDAMTLDRAEADRRLALWSQHRAPAAAGRAAAVAIVVFSEVAGPAVSTVIPRRSPSLRAHPGQWALPGGRMDAGETPEVAARREVSEEIGLELGAESVVGRLDDYVTLSGFRITPVVLWSTADPSRLVANVEEVAGIVTVPLDELDVDAVYLDDPLLPTPVLRLPFRGRHIHAPTGAFLVQFREVVMRGRPTRVHMYSSPRRLDRPR